MCAKEGCIEGLKELRWLMTFGTTVRLWSTFLLTFHYMRKITTPTSTNCGVCVCVCVCVCVHARVFPIVGCSLKRYRHGAS